MEDVSKELQDIIDEETAELNRQIELRDEVIKHFIRITGIPLKTVMDTIGIPAVEQSGYNALI